MTNTEKHLSPDAEEILVRLYDPAKQEAPLVVSSETESDRFTACLALMRNRLVTMREIATIPRVWLVWPAMQPCDPGSFRNRPERRKAPAEDSPVTIPASGELDRKETPAEAVKRRLGWMRVPVSRVQFIPQEFAVGTTGWLWQSPDKFYFSADPQDCPASLRSRLKAAILRDRTVRFVWFSLDGPEVSPAAATPLDVLSALKAELAGESLDHGIDPEDSGE